MYVKRNTIGKFWPVPRKGTKYLARAMHEKKKSIPLIVVMRDVLGMVKNKKELQKVLNEKRIKVNDKIIREVNFPVLFFDVISVPDIKKYFRAIYSKHGKMIFEEVSEKEGSVKIYKVDNKKILGKKKVQINLSDGRNILSDKKINVNDSVLFNFAENKIEGILELKGGAGVVVLQGKHIGRSGRVENIKDGGKFAEINMDGEKIIKNIRDIIVVK